MARESSRAEAVESSGANAVGLLVATVSDSRSEQSVLNWALHLQQTSTPHVVAALSKQLLQQLHAYSVPSYLVPDGPSEVNSGPSHATTGWKHFAFTRVREMGRLMSLGVHVLMADADVAFVQSPIPCIKHFVQSLQATPATSTSNSRLCEQLDGADVAISSDNLGPERDEAQGATYAAGGLLNTGITFLSATPAGRRWQQAWENNLAPDTSSGTDSHYTSFNTDQQVFNAMLRTPKQWPGTAPAPRGTVSQATNRPVGRRVLVANGPGPSNGTFVGVLPLKLFAHGHSYFIRGLKEQPIAVHATYTLDTAASDSKKLRLQENGLWKLRSVPESSNTRFLTYEPSLTHEKVGTGIAKHIAAVETHVSELRGALAVAKALNRWLVVPYNLYCACDRVWGGHDNVFSRGCRYPGSEEANFLPLRCPLDHIAAPSRWRAANELIVPEKAVSSALLRSDMLTVPVGLEYRPSHSNGLRDWSSKHEIQRKLGTRTNRTIRLTGNVARAFGGDTNSVNATERIDAQMAHLLRPPEWCTECLFKRCSEWVPQSVHARGRLISTRRNTQEMICIPFNSPLPVAPRLQPTTTGL